MSRCWGWPHPIDLLRGELPAAEADDARRHLMACEACAQEAVAVGDVRSLLGKAPRAEPSRGFVGRVVAAVEGGKVARRLPWRQWAARPVPAWGISFAFHAAAFVILAFAFYAQLKPRPGEGPPGPVAPATQPPALQEPEHAEAFGLTRRQEARAEMPKQVSAACVRVLEGWPRQVAAISERHRILLALAFIGHGRTDYPRERTRLITPDRDRPPPLWLGALYGLEGAEPAAGIGPLLFAQRAQGGWAPSADQAAPDLAATAWAVLALRVADSKGMHFVHDALAHARAWAESLPEDTIYKRFILDRRENLPAPRDEQEAFFCALLGADVSYLLDQQGEDGSWGGDVERTLYAVLALQAPYLYPRPAGGP